MKIGIIGAMQMEVDELKIALGETTTVNYSGVDFVCGTMDGIDVVAAVCGIGKVFAAICAEAMILKFDVDMVINIGVAGSLTKDLGVLDVALASQVCQHDMDTSPLGDPVGLISGINQIFFDSNEAMRKLMAECLMEEGIKYKIGTVASGDQFIASEEKKEWICSHFEAIAAEMEGASIGHVCFINKVPFLILRSISDGAGGAMDYATFAEKAALQSIDVVIKFVKKANTLELA